ncbi:MAG: hypothetical protein IJ833_02980 [Lachnospiraceae bacterium]|nr:hypothetical protein [Lachnospiraceae bacterium]
MAKEKSPEIVAAEAERKKLKEEKKQLKKEVKQRAKEIARQEDALDDEDEGGGLVAFGATILIVALWLAIICVIIKMDIGGFGSGVLTPLLKDVPVVNRILPGVSVTETTDAESYGGYTNLRDAVNRIQELELEVERLKGSTTVKDDEVETLKAEVLRLQEFEKKQVEFQRIRTEFYEEVVYADKGPGAEEYQKYYETMDPTTAEYIYKQVIVQLQESKEVQDYAAAYSQMEPKNAARIFETMTDNLDLVARILKTMNPEPRGAILAQMDAGVAGRLTKIMDPES